MKRKKRMLSRSRGEISIAQEIAYIIARAVERDSRLVAFGSIVLFSTVTGDAWMLDPEDHLALCLARDGVEQEYTVVDSADNFQIHWNARYEIQGDAFNVVTQDGRVVSITGYPVQEILGAATTTG
jgi:hypothetical protein